MIKCLTLDCGKVQFRMMSCVVPCLSNSFAFSFPHGPEWAVIYHSSTMLVVAMFLISTSTNTKSLAKEFSKILIFEYFGCLKIGIDVFFDADSESPRMT